MVLYLVVGVFVAFVGAAMWFGRGQSRRTDNWDAGEDSGNGSDGGHLHGHGGCGGGSSCGGGGCGGGGGGD